MLNEMKGVGEKCEDIQYMATMQQICVWTYFRRLYTPETNSYSKQKLGCRVMRRNMKLLSEQLSFIEKKFLFKALCVSWWLLITTCTAAIRWRRIWLWTEGAPCHSTSPHGATGLVWFHAISRIWIPVLCRSDKNPFITVRKIISA